MQKSHILQAKRLLASPSGYWSGLLTFSCKVGLFGYQPLDVALVLAGQIGGLFPVKIPHI